jgi:competence protein ComEA
MNIRIVVAAALIAAVLLGAARGVPRPPAIAPAAAPAPPAFHPRAQAVAAVVYVAGAVLRPGLYRLPPGARWDDALRRAGGFRAGADQAAVNLAQRASDGEEIRVPRVGESTPRPAARRTSRSRKGRAPAAAIAPVDLNTADAAALALLPGVGATLASRIVAYRDVNGAFSSIDELADVSGMTQRRVDALAPYLEVNEGR